MLFATLSKASRCHRCIYIFLFSPTLQHSFWGDCWHFIYSCSLLAFLIQYRMICMCVLGLHDDLRPLERAERQGNPKQERSRRSEQQGPKSQVSRVVERRVDFDIFHSNGVAWLGSSWTDWMDWLLFPFSHIARGTNPQIN